VTGVYVLAAIVLTGAVLKLLDLIARNHEGKNFRVSDAWLNEHIRGRRDL
jgi:hypothetical protein